MTLFLANTDNAWFRFLQQERPDEVNFWQPGGGQNFKVLPQGGPFLFKLKSPHHVVAGVGFFATHTRLPLSVAWEIFGKENGTDQLEVFRKMIMKYRNDGEPNPVIGCIVLTDPVFFDESDWIEVPGDWSKNIVQGKSYQTDDFTGRALWEKVERVLRKYQWMDRQPDLKSQLVEEPLVAGEYREIVSRVRIGQSTFRTLITDAYQRRCAISGEKTLPVLEAAHIKPYAESGPHSIRNGLLLRSDLHKLFDNGYLTVTSDYRIEVSKRIREEFENGKDYYKYQGEKLLILPSQAKQQPDKAYLDWHNTNRFNG